MTRRTLVYFDHETTPLKKQLRLYINNGVVMNPKVEETAKATEGVHLVGLHRTGEGYRSLIIKPEEGAS